MRYFLFFFVLAACGQDFAIPLIGHIFDPQMASIRQIQGTPGAARVTAAVPVETAFSKAVVNGSLALASSPEPQGLWTVTIDSESRLAPIPEALTSFDVAALSPAGAAAVVYQRDCGCIQTFAGLPGEPHVTATTSVPMEGEVRALAVSDDGSMVAVATRRESGEGAVHLFRGAEWQPTSDTASPSVAFAPGSERFVWVDEARAEVRMLTLASGEISAIAPDGEVWIEPSAVGFASPTRLIVGSGNGAVTVRDLETQEARTVECACRPEVVERLAAPGMFRLTGLSTGAVWVLADIDTEPRTYFVPVESGEPR